MFLKSREVIFVRTLVPNQLYDSFKKHDLHKKGLMVGFTIAPLVGAWWTIHMRSAILQTNELFILEYLKV